MRAALYVFFLLLVQGILVPKKFTAAKTGTNKAGRLGLASGQTRQVGFSHLPN
jgi:hypothetical protein